MFGCSTEQHSALAVHRARLAEAAPLLPARLQYTHTQGVLRQAAVLQLATCFSDLASKGLPASMVASFCAQDLLRQTTVLKLAIIP